MTIALAATAAPAASDRGATELPEYAQRLIAQLSPDADKVISVVGALRSPRTIPPAEGLTVSKAIALAGGFGDFAIRSRVGVWKPKAGRYFTVNIKAVLAKEPNAEDPPLSAGDVVIINQRVDYF
jgi:protein involved in polysaccharide export with SLBB domain